MSEPHFLSKVKNYLASTGIYFFNVLCEILSKLAKQFSFSSCQTHTHTHKQTHRQTDKLNPFAAIMMLTFWHPLCHVVFWLSRVWLPNLMLCIQFWWYPNEIFCVFLLNKYLFIDIIGFLIYAKIFVICLFLW